MTSAMTVARSELRSLTQHPDPTAARLAAEALHALDRLEFRRAALAGAPTHLRAPADKRDAGVVHTLGPAPEDGAA